MVTISQALVLIQNNSISKDKELIHVKDAVNRVAVEDIVATVDVKAFDAALFDGYLVCGKKILKEPLPIDLKHHINAGYIGDDNLDPNDAIPINTGGIIDSKFDTVIKTEDVNIKDNKVHLKNKIQIGGGIEKKGSLLKEGEIIINKHESVKADHVEKLIMSGIYNICVLEKPQIGILCVGDEFLSIDKVNHVTSLYPSNGYYIYARLKEQGYEVNDIKVVGDDATDIETQIERLLQANDYVITTGGCGNSNKDLMQSWVTKSGFKLIFNGLFTKKARGVIYAKRNNKVVLCLSGNPFAMKECFELLTWEMLRSNKEGETSDD